MASQTPTDLQLQTLTALVDEVIPSSSDGRMPGAAEVGCADYLLLGDDVIWLLKGLDELIEICRERHGCDLLALSAADRAEFVGFWRRKAIRASIRLANEVIQYYYQNDRVLEAIGMPARAPFPEGFPVEEGDLLLLEPVYERGRVYRD